MVGFSRVGFDEAIFEPAEEPGRAVHMHLPNNVHSGCPMVLSVVSRMHLNRCACCTYVRSRQQGSAQCVHSRAESRGGRYMCAYAMVHPLSARGQHL
jgi:hypothetical protein